MHLKSAALLALLSTAAAGAQAADYAFGEHGPLETSGLVEVASPFFFDTYSFSLASESELSSSVSGIGLVGGTYSLFSAGLDGMLGGGDDSFVAGYAISTTNPAQVNMLTVDSGFYYYTVSAGVPGTGVYNLSSAVIAVPEPGTYGLMLAGAGVVGLIAARRRRAD